MFNILVFVFSLLFINANASNNDTFKLNQGLIHKPPFSFVGRIYHYKQNDDCSMTKVYLCNTIMISQDKAVTPYDCLNNVTSDLYLLINTTEYRLKHILTPINHTNSSTNWAIAHTNTTVITNMTLLNHVLYASRNVLKEFELPYMYMIGYNKYILNGTILNVRMCNLKTINPMIEVKTITQIPLYYYSWNMPKNLLYNKNNISGDFVVHTRNYSDNIIRHTSICMNSYTEIVDNKTHTTCISIPFMSYINEQNVNNKLNMSLYTKYNISHRVNTNFDSNCNPIKNFSSGSVIINLHLFNLALLVIVVIGSI